MLGFHPGAADGVYGSMVEQAVEELQERSGIIADGVFGRRTAEWYNELVQRSPLTAAFEVFLRGPADLPGEEILGNMTKLKWQTVKLILPAGVKAGRDTYKSAIMREDAAAALIRLRNEMHTYGACLTTAGGRRPLGAKVRPSRSATSLHYLGRAFDLGLPTGMQNPDVDNFVLVRRPDDPRRWTVFARCVNPPAAHLPRTLNADYVVSLKSAKTGKRYTQIQSRAVTGYFVDVSALAMSHGFVGIRCRSSFLKGGSYLGAEWWHLQYERGLVPGETTFGEELLKVYDLATIKAKFKRWEDSKDLVFGEGWA